ncbi:extracellular solute-binding protein [Bifidobacterium sp.]|jgi:multiple sugar transport system substrate-binding protein|uniref:extracellular solute-binding protein n=1 Tax=Bifidobacterium sp. TaxID=41200 RepID=UPI0025C4DEA1|nr:extracellular solute-binding protein [Bifidobacterium sp.]MCH4208917.1 extracellular solute-binding protein [Bifidobacterium sp.]MCI1224464.1 extracellular solute-binding protein [Bifidobacterium sp.]
MSNNKTKGTVALSLAAVLLLSGCGSGFSSGSGAASGKDSAGKLTSDTSRTLQVLIGSSGDAETQAVTKAVADWSKQSGRKAKVIAASDGQQQLSQGFASGDPADVFYLSPDYLAGYAANGSLLAYGDMMDTSDYYPSVLKSLSYDGKLYAVPKDVSTLQLVINTDMWSAAGFTEADYPKNWADLAAVAKKLTKPGQIGLSFGGEYARIGVFFAQAGGGLVKDGKAVADSAASVKALTEVKSLLTSGVAAYASDLGAGWGGEAFGTKKAAMTIEGNWLSGTMQSDYPDVKYKAIELPAGPAGKGTLQFTNGWGIAADSKDQKGALDLVKYLTGDDVVMSFSKAFGVMPASKKLGAEYKKQYPDMSAFADGLAYATGLPNQKGAATVLGDLNSSLETLKKSNPKTILDKAQTNYEAIL